jgi:chromate transporter
MITLPRPTTAPTLPGLVRSFSSLLLGTGPADEPARSERKSREADSGATADAPAARSTRVGLGRLMSIYLWLGSISFGGKSMGYQFDEFVCRRGWLTVEDYNEAFAISRVLPGPSGTNTAVFIARVLGGWSVAALCVAPYVIPGAVMILALAVLIGTGDRPAWLEGALRGVSTAAVGLVLSNLIHNVKPTRAVRLGPVLAALAFVANGLLGMDMVAVMLVLVPLSLACNRPGR